jgi:putative ABC transport system substrate-binding protein
MQIDRMRRREFIVLLGGAAAMSSSLWPLAARAQQPSRMRHIGVLMNVAADDPDLPNRLAPFLQGLQEVGWTVGRNVRIDYRFGAGDPDRIRRFAEEMVALAPDVILATGGTIVGPLQQVSRKVPIVFVNVTDPVGSGFVESLARPGGNATGFTLFEYSIAGKWLELLKQIAPRVTRAAVLRDAGLTSGGGQLGALQGAAHLLGVELTPVGVRDAGEIERGIAAIARGTNGGLIVTSSSFAGFHRELIVMLAARHRLPAVYAARTSVTAGGLISYGPDNTEQYRQAAGYVDRILKGEKPSDLPVQAPVRFETVLNRKTAKALGLDVPVEVLVRATEVID